MRRWAAWLAAACAAFTMADPSPDHRAQAALEAMLAEPLAETSPTSLGWTNYLLTKSFNRGMDDLDSYVYLLKLVIQHTLNLAEHDPAYKAVAIPMTYNLAANTWIGWGPEQVGPVAESHRRLGLEAARKNVELAAEVGLPPERRRNGYWVLGAHLLAAGEYAKAAEQFATSSALGKESGDDAATLMAQGWVHVANILAGEDEEAQLQAAQDALRDMGNDGVFYADQYATALGIFGHAVGPNGQGEARARQ